MFDKRFLKTLGAVGFALVVLAGCRQEEQGRPWHSEPGVYPGKQPASSLGEGDLAQLRQRAVEQGGIPAGGLASGGGPTRSGNVRPPVVDTEADNQLQDRNKLQSGN